MGRGPPVYVTGEGLGEIAALDVFRAKLREKSGMHAAGDRSSLSSCWPRLRAIPRDPGLARPA